MTFFLYLCPSRTKRSIPVQSLDRLSSRSLSGQVIGTLLSLFIISIFFYFIHISSIFILIYALLSPLLSSSNSFLFKFSQNIIKKIIFFHVQQFHQREFNHKKKINKGRLAIHWSKDLLLFFSFFFLFFPRPQFNF